MTNISIARAAQTFTIDPASVKMAEQINITSIDLFFKSKPTALGNASGTQEPGVLIYLVPTAGGGLPNYGNSLDNFSAARQEYTNIQSSLDASTSTKFTFISPVPVRTGVEYAIIVKYDNDDPGYVLWAATEGEINVDTKLSSAGIAGKYQGKYFELSGSSSNWQPLTYKNLKFIVYVARYAYDGVIPAGTFPQFDLNIRNYEYVSYNQSIGTFYNGEYVYKKLSSPSGVVSVLAGQSIATTTGGGFAGLFSPTGDDSYIVVLNNDQQNVRKVLSVSNDNNTIQVDENFSFSNSSSNFYRTAVAKVYIVRTGSLVSGTNSFLILSDSNANSTVRFTNNCVLVGEQTGTTVSGAYFNDIIVHSTEPHVYVYAPALTSFNTKQYFGYTSTDDLTGIIAYPPPGWLITLYSPSNLDTIGQPVMLKSRSNEVDLQGWSSTVKSVSSKLTFNITSTNDYTSPQIDYNATDVLFTRYIINNDATNENTTLGNALSKHITTKIPLGRSAEDLVVYMQAYKPAGTNLKIYAKIFNSQDSDYFIDKDWTEMIETSGNRASSLSNLNDYIEYSYGLKTSPDVKYLLPGYVKLTSGSTTVTSVGSINFQDTNIGLKAGDLVKIYSQLFPEDYIIYSVYSVDSATQITLNTPVSASDYTAIGTSTLQIAKLTLPHQAFINTRNNNTVRYFNSNMSLFDKFDTFAIKIVFLSESSFIIPKVSTLRAIGVSA